MNIKLSVAVMALSSMAVVMSCSDATTPKPIVTSPHGPDKVYVYIPEYSYVECGGGYQWINGQWTMVTECYQKAGGGGGRVQRFV
jgi:hypothetical protein